MATRAFTVEPVKGFPNVVKVTWSGLLVGDDGAPFDWLDYVDRSIQVEGTFGTATFLFEGTNSEAAYHPLTDPQGNDISKTAADLEAVTEFCRLVRPRNNGGDGTTNLVATLLCRRPR